ncbi:MAG: hypothetical protein WDO71_25150 [Bacteroidota bacterium]
MRKIILILFLSISFLNLFSQQDSVLKNFKFRNSNYRAITMNIGGGSNFSNTELVSGSNKNHNSSGSAGASYYANKSTDRILFNMSGGLYGSFSAGRSKNSSDDDKNRNLSFAPNFSILNKWFSRKFFTELGADMSAQSYNSKSTDISPLSEQKNKRNNQSLAIIAGIGKGRLENITDMQNALWLNKGLEKEGRLSRTLSAGELNGLGRAITAANNTRVLDARKRTQFILETIDGYFQQNGLINKTDIKYFSNLNDIVFFAFNEPRLSGTETFIRLRPAITNFSDNNSRQPADEKTGSRATSWSALLSMGVSKYVPMNLKHQNNYGASLRLYYFSNHSNEKFYTSGILINEFDFNPELRQAGVALFFQHAIYPNTRTIISFRLDSETGYQDVGDESGFFWNSQSYRFIELLYQLPHPLYL